MTDSASANNTAAGLRYGRIAGQVMGTVLIVWGLTGFTGGELPTAFDQFKFVYFLILGSIVQLPYQRLGEKAWKAAFAVLCLLAAGFVFVMVVSVMFAYMEYAERGEKLGVPGLEGTLVFLTLLQPPLVLFQRKPDLLD